MIDERNYDDALINYENSDEDIIFYDHVKSISESKYENNSDESESEFVDLINKNLDKNYTNMK